MASWIQFSIGAFFTVQARQMSPASTAWECSVSPFARTMRISPSAAPGYVTVFAWAAHMRHVPVRQTLLGFAWAWLENQLAVACKAMPLGHTAAQRLTERLRPKLVHAVDQALTREDNELGPVLPGLALASAHHETQYSRLFRS